MGDSCFHNKIGLCHIMSHPKENVLFREGHCFVTRVSTVQITSSSAELKDAKENDSRARVKEKQEKVIALKRASKLKEPIKRLKLEPEKFKCQKQELEMELEQLKRQNQQLEMEREKFKHQIQELETHVDELNDELETQRTRHAHQVTKLQKQLIAKQKEYTESEKKFLK